MQVANGFVVKKVQLTLEFSNYLGSSYWEARQIGGGIKEFELGRQLSYGPNFREVKKNQDSTNCICREAG